MNEGTKYYMVPRGFWSSWLCMTELNNSGDVAGRKELIPELIIEDQIYYHGTNKKLIPRNTAYPSNLALLPYRYG